MYHVFVACVFHSRKLCTVRIARVVTGIVSLVCFRNVLPDCWICFSEAHHQGFSSGTLVSSPPSSVNGFSL